jgi:two-component system, OmpR family, alkaline phosphatase synthesis response regulator PhoP
LIILDPLLPGFMGQEVLDGIRKTNRTVPVLILTAKGKLFEKGCDEYPTKPFALGELQALVRTPPTVTFHQNFMGRSHSFNKPVVA